MIQEIVSNASGVFLWVRLVVASLMRGLGHDDSIEELHARVRVFPKDLDSLYGHMIQKVDEIYKEESSRIFRLVWASLTPRGGDWSGVSPLTALGLHFAVEDHDTKALAAPLKFLSHEAASNFSKKMIAKLDTRTGGLLEAQVHRRVGHAKAKITYMHRTVKDYFEKADNQDIFHSGTKPWTRTAKTFIPNLAIFKATILVLKSLESHGYNSYALGLIDTAITYARRVQIDGEVPVSCTNSLTEELIKISSIWIKQSELSRPVFNPTSTRYTIAVQCGLYHYLRHILEEDKAAGLARNKRDLMFLADNPSFGYERFRSREVITILDEFGFGQPEEPGEKSDKGGVKRRFALRGILRLRRRD